MEKISEERYMNDLIELTNRIRERPEIYIGEKSLVKFYHFINGFAEAYHYLDKEKKYFGVYPGFQKWIEDKYKVKMTKSWCNILIFHSSTDRDALDLFFKKFDLFLEEQIKL